ncbi:MAG: M6 family metalloprotease domain-containing protein, partial [Candidatus Cryptobacteroides sp.]
MRTKLISLAAVLLSLSCLCTPESVSARSVNRGRVVFHQPDGSAFFGSVMGDDFFRIKMTSSGECIIRDDDGWWCYAAFDSSGRRYSSGVRVGTNDAAARSASRDIPYPMLMQKASERRRIFDGELQTRRESFNAQRALTKAGGTPTVRHGIIILTEFSDVSFKYSKSDIEAMICSAGYTNTSGAPGSAKDYFEAQFGDGYEFQFEVSDIVKLTKKRAYYGSNDSDGYDKYAEEMVRDACILADAAGVDFSKYDDDGDGIVDTVFVIYAGEDEAETEIEEYIWAHQYYLLSQYSITLDGKKIYSYACASELGVEYDSKWNITGTYLAGIGTFCHEYSHTFGLKDLYDTDYQESGGTAEAMWLSTGLMDGGNMNNKGNNPPNWNAVDRMQLNIGNCMELTPGRHNLKPISENGDYYKLESGTDGEFFLIECRSNQNVWDKYIGGSGLLVYHIDQTKASVWSKNSNEVNVNPSHQYADLVEPTKGMRNS